MTTTTIPDVPVPAGAVTVHEWYDPGAPFGILPMNYGPDTQRTFNGTNRGIPVERRTGHHDDIEVAIYGEQYADGRIVREIGVYELHSDSPITSGEARALAATLIEAADEIDGWAGR
jgi:hypothetical protein